MAKSKSKFMSVVWEPTNPPKRTSQGGKRPKMASMNKSKKRQYKKYRGQGR